MRTPEKALRGVPACGGFRGAWKGSLILIHTNNSPNPALARPAARFDLPGGVTLQEAEKLISERLKIGLPLAHLVVRRSLDGHT
jgi:hypothetical protein